MYGAVIIETRDIPELPLIIGSHINYLPKTWGLTIFHGSSNIGNLKECFSDAIFIDLKKETLSGKELNSLLTSFDFWDKIIYDKILMFQSDSMIIRTGIEEFLEWDYVGAPWGTQENGGNGGLSIRDKKSIMKLIDFLPYMGYDIHDNEDRYLSNYLHIVGGKIAPREVCFKFSCESIYKLGALGYHAIDEYLTEEECIKIRDQYK